MCSSRSAVGSTEVRDKNNNYQAKGTVQTLDNPKKDVGGCWFDSQFNLYTTDREHMKVVKFNLANSHTASPFANTNLATPQLGRDGGQRGRVCRPCRLAAPAPADTAATASCSIPTLRLPISAASTGWISPPISGRCSTRREDVSSNGSMSRRTRRVRTSHASGNRHGVRDPVARAEVQRPGRSARRRHRQHQAAQWRWHRRRDVRLRPKRHQ